MAARQASTKRAFFMLGNGSDDTHLVSKNFIAGVMNRDWKAMSS